MGDMNFIPAERLVRRRRRARIRMWGIVCLAFYLLLAAVSLAAHIGYLGDDVRVTEQLTVAGRQVQADNRKMLELRRALAQATATLQTTRSMHEQPDWSKLLVIVAQEMGQEMVLTRWHLVTFVDDKALTNEVRESLVSKPLGALLAQRRYMLTLNGYGRTQESVSRFVLKLETADLFDRVRLVNSCRQTFLKGEAVAFTVECRF